MNHMLHVHVNFILNFLKQPVKIYMLKYKNLVTKTCFQKGFGFIKKNLIYNKKFGTATKVKLVTKIRKHNHLHLGTLVLALY